MTIFPSAPALVEEKHWRENFLATQRWQYRCVKATGGNSTKIGTILLAILGKSRPARAFGHAAAINAEGKIITRWVDRDGRDQGLIALCTVQELCDNFSGLADVLKLSDEDRVALFTSIRTWITLDERAIKEPLHFSKGGL